MQEDLGAQLEKEAGAESLSGQYRPSCQTSSALENGGVPRDLETLERPHLSRPPSSAFLLGGGMLALSPSWLRLQRE